MKNKPSSKRLGSRIQQKAIAIRTHLHSLSKGALRIGQSLPSSAINLISRLGKTSVRDKRLEKERRVGFHQNYHTHQKPYEPI